MYLQVLLRSIFSLVVLFLLTKWIGCRQMSEMSMFDYINGITIGSIAAEMAASDIDFVIPLIAMVRPVWWGMTGWRLERGTATGQGS